jgi:ATP-dependent Clp protease protease subunit
MIENKHNKIDDLDSILTLGVDIKNREIFFGDILSSKLDEGSEANEISWNSVERLIRIMEFLRILNKDLPVTINGSSPGGCQYQMLRLIDYISQYPCKVVFKGSGDIFSSMAFIMAVCDHRVLTENSFIMIHDGYAEISSNVGDGRIDFIHSEALRVLGHKILANNSYLDEKTWSRLCQRDLIITAQEGIELGLVDEIIKPIKRTSFRQNRLKKNRQKDLPAKIEQLEKRLNLK